MASEQLRSHAALFAGRINDTFHSGHPQWKPNNPLVKNALDRIIGHDKTFLRKLTDRMITRTKRDNLILETVKMYAPELGRPANGGQGKGAGKGKATNDNNNNNNNKGKGKGKGKGKNPATAFAQLRPCSAPNMIFYPDGTAAPVIDGNHIHIDLTGVAMMSKNLGIMEEMVAQGGQFAMQPLAIILPNTNKEALDRLDALPILHKFRPVPIT